MQAQATLTLYDALLPRRGILIDGAIVLTASAIVALCAQVAIPLPFSPVPVTGQTFAVLLVGAVLGSKRGALSLMAYLGQGMAGLPVFASGGSGPGVLLGPTGGYLVGFVAAAWAVGRLCEMGWDRRVGSTVLAMLAGSAVIYVFGLSWLARFVPASMVLTTGLLPFVPGDLAKLALAAVALPSGWKLMSAVQRP